MKTWRVYLQYLNGKEKFVCLSRKRDGPQVTAFMLSLGMVHERTDGADVFAILLRSPDGREWCYEVPPKSTPERAASAEERLNALTPEELAKRRREAGARVWSYFDGETPRPSQSVERVMEKFRQKLAEAVSEAVTA